MRKKCQLSACAIMKNEGSYLAEWLEFHKIVGVERFYLYDNNSTDNTLEVVESYIESGEVIYHQWPYQPGQQPAYLHCLKNYSRESDWIAFIDLDEFLFPSKADDLRVILSEFIDHPAVVVNWLVFGNSGHERKPLGLQIENYTKRAEVSKYPANLLVKSIVRPELTISPVNPHAFRYLKGLPVSEKKEPLKAGKPRSLSHSVKKIRINHYLTRSSEETRQKIARGRADTIKKKKDFSAMEAQQAILNEVEDLRIQRFLPKLKIALEKRDTLQSKKTQVHRLSKTLPPLEPLESQGRLGRIAMDKNKKELVLSGWAASLYFGSADGFKLSIAGEELSQFELTCDLPSPTIKKAYPYLDKRGKAGFKLRVPLNRKKIKQYRNSLICLTPLFHFQQYAGCLLVNVFNPTVNNKEVFEWLGYLIQKAGLSPTDSFLEIGCGVFQIASSLAYYFKDTAIYQGFHIAEGDTSPAREEIVEGKSNFHFDRYDIYHPIYNSTGTLAAAEFVFPYPENSFTCASVRDLFVNLPETEVKHYLGEISRVLKPKARCLLACFLLNEDRGNISQNLIDKLGDRLNADVKFSEGTIGLREALLLQWIEELGLQVSHKSYGSWCGRLSCHYEDLLILEKQI